MTTPLAVFRKGRAARTARAAAGLPFQAIATMGAISAGGALITRIGMRANSRASATRPLHGPRSSNVTRPTTTRSASGVRADRSKAWADCSSARTIRPPFSSSSRPNCSVISRARASTPRLRSAWAWREASRKAGGAPKPSAMVAQSPTTARGGARTALTWPRAARARSAAARSVSASSLAPVSTVRMLAKLMAGLIGGEALRKLAPPERRRVAFDQPREVDDDQKDLLAIAAGWLDASSNWSPRHDLS